MLLLEMECCHFTFFIHAFTVGASLMKSKSHPASELKRPDTKNMCIQSKQMDEQGPVLRRRSWFQSRHTWLIRDAIGFLQMIKLLLSHDPILSMKLLRHADELSVVVEDDSIQVDRGKFSSRRANDEQDRSNHSRCWCTEGKVLCHLHLWNSSRLSMLLHPLPK